MPANHFDGQLPATRSGEQDRVLSAPAGSSGTGSMRSANPRPAWSPRTVNIASDTGSVPAGSRTSSAAGRAARPRPPGGGEPAGRSGACGPRRVPRRWSARPAVATTPSSGEGSCFARVMAWTGWLGASVPALPDPTHNRATSRHDPRREPRLPPAPQRLRCQSRRKSPSGSGHREVDRRPDRSSVEQCHERRTGHSPRSAAHAPVRSGLGIDAPPPRGRHSGSAAGSASRPARD